MKKINLLMLVAITMCVVACGGEQEITLKTTIGDVGEFTTYASFPDEVKMRIIKEEEDNDNEDEVNLVLTTSITVNTPVCYDKSQLSFGYDVVDENFDRVAHLCWVHYDDIWDYDIEDDFDHHVDKGTIHDERKFSLTTQEWNDVLSKGAYVRITGSYGAEYKPYAD